MLINDSAYSFPRIQYKVDFTCERCSVNLQTDDFHDILALSHSGEHFIVECPVCNETNMIINTLDERKRYAMWRHYAESDSSLGKHMAQFMVVGTLIIILISSFFFVASPSTVMEWIRLFT